MLSSGSIRMTAQTGRRGVVGVLLLLCGPSGCGAEPGDPSSYGFQAEVCPSSGDPEIVDLLKPIRTQFGIPAMVAAVVTADGLQASAVVGVRKVGTDVAATLDDAWHLGSNTKAMNAMLAATLVEAERLRWDSSVAEVFPEVANDLHPDARAITLRDLLSHRAGVPANLSLRRYAGSDVRDLRLRAVRRELAQAPKPPLDAGYQYSNLGYILAGAMIERVTDAAWEERMRTDIFGPLAMAETGFGGVGTPGKLDQPWGHDDRGRPVSRNGPDMDNPPVMGPAGRVHAPIHDWAKFVADLLRGAQGLDGLLSADAYRPLWTPPAGGTYGLGWMVLERDWANGAALHHAGSNTMNYSNAWVAPSGNLAVLVCLNRSGDEAFKASDAAVGALIRWWQAKPVSN